MSLPFQCRFYNNWTTSRMNGLKKYLPADFFKNKTLLELGGGDGHCGKKFQELGAIVTCSDAREKHLIDGKQLYPDLTFMLLDCDKEKISTKYDIILHWGVLYHLKAVDNHLKNVCDNCDILILETEVADSDSDDFVITTQEEGIDQAFNGKGIRPSPSYIEKVLKNNNFEYRMIKDNILNSDDFHFYDWEITNSNGWKGGYRRFWICWRKGTEINFNQ